MKKTAFAFFAILIFSANSYSQNCTRRITNFIMAPGGFAINGTASLELMPDSSLLLTFDNNFTTSAGPDLYVFLAKKNDRPGAAGNANYRVAPLDSIKDFQTYVIPDSISLTKYDWVLIHCVAQNHYWGGGLLCPLENCLAGIDGPESITSLILYPNPSTGIVYIQSITSPIHQLQIYDLAGRLVWNKEVIKSGSGTYTADLSVLNDGLYFARVMAGKNEVVRKLLITDSR